LLGAVLGKRGAIPCDREKADLSAARGIFGRLRQGEPVGIFPQGTRVPDSRLAECPPHAGAAHFAIKTGVPIVPVWVDPFRLFKPVRVIYGSPFRLAADTRTHYSHDDLQDFSCQIMQHVFSLANRNYPCQIGAGSGHSADPANDAGSDRTAEPARDTGSAGTSGGPPPEQRL